MVRQLGLEATFAAVLSRAAGDKVDVAALPTHPVMTVRGRGGPLDDIRAQDAVLLSMDWAGAAKAQFPAGDGTIVATIGSAAPQDVTLQPADFAKAVELLKVTNVGSFDVRLVVEKTDPLLLISREWASRMHELGLAVEVQTVDPGSGGATYDDDVASGVPALWLAEGAGL